MQLIQSNLLIRSELIIAHRCYDNEQKRGKGDRMRQEDKKVKKTNQVAIITGASSGFGASLTRALDAWLGKDVSFWLIARDLEKLNNFASEFSRPTRVFPTDLTKHEDYTAISKALAAEKPKVVLLVNNAGEGCAGRFQALDLMRHDSLCDLNVRAQLKMTSLSLPYMSNESRILFTSSVAAFLPQPGFATYAASKSFILSFGRALREELREEGIGVTVTCPNPMLTPFFTEAQKQELQNSYKRLGIEDPDRSAKRTVRALKKNKALVVTGFMGKLIRFAAWLLPTGLMLRLIRFD